MSQFNQSNLTTSEKAAVAGAAGSGTLVIIGFAIAIFAVVLMNVYVEMRVRAQQEDTVTFFKFKDDLKAGAEIEADDLDPVQVPVSMQESFGLSAIRENPERPGTPIDGLGNKLNTAVSARQMLTSDLLFGSGTTSVRPVAYQGLDEITLNIDSKKQPTNLRPGDFVDLYASVPMNRNTRYMRVMEYVRVVNLGDRVQESGTRAKSNKYGSITIYVDPDLSTKLFDVQKRVDGQTFNVTRRDPRVKTPRDLKIGGSKEINEEVLDILNLNN